LEGQPQPETHLECPHHSQGSQNDSNQTLALIPDLPGNPAHCFCLFRFERYLYGWVAEKCTSANNGIQLLSCHGY
jgi:hypothetical protein